MKDRTEVTKPPPIPWRDPDSHKGTYGRVLLLAGSVGMAGAAILAARAALRTGAGLVTVAIPPELSAVLATAVPEATQLFLSEEHDHESLKGIFEPSTRPAFDAIALGPGLGTSSANTARVRWLLTHPSAPQVVDADALNIVAATVGSTKKLASFSDRVWTPHPGEFKRLTSLQPTGEDERREAASEAVDRFGGVVLLKGHRTVIVDDSQIAVNTTGNPGMATGGSGDVLTGMIAALLAQGFSPFSAAHLGAHLHGLAADFAWNRVGELSLVASDLIDALSSVIVSYQRDCAS